MASYAAFNYQMEMFMNMEKIRDYLKSLPGSEEGSPFGKKSLVYKIEGKMFCTFGHEYQPQHLTLKAEPEIIPSLIDGFDEVIPGYYMNKKHWFTIELNQSISDDFIQKHILNSYKLVFSKLPKKLQALYDLSIVG